MRVKPCDIERFMDDAGNHVMTIEHDNGVFRSIYYGRKDSSSYHFRLNTWPGHLCISGDMGTYVFARLPDMFEFFRNDSLEKINPDYWSGKIESIDKHSKVQEFSGEQFRDRIKESFDNWAEEIREENDPDIGETEISEQWERVQTEIFSVLEYSGENAAFEAAINFEEFYSLDFSEYWEVNCDEYTFHFIWCLYAIVWGIQQYDAAKNKAAESIEIDGNISHLNFD